MSATDGITPIWADANGPDGKVKRWDRPGNRSWPSGHEGRTKKDVGNRMTEDSWGQAQLELRKAVGKNAFTSWIEPLQLVSLDDGIARFDVPTNFMRDWVTRNYSEQIRQHLTKAGTALVFINSVCGCAAGGARPGLHLALQQAAKKPQQATTVFAGVDKEAVSKARGYFAEFPPSSPSAALLKDGEVVWMLHRHQIEGRHPEQIAEAFRKAFEQFC